MADTSPAVYSSGAAFYTANNIGKLKTTSREKVDNLNAELLQGETPSSFIKTSSAASGASRITQGTNTLTFNNEVVQFTGADAKIKIGNVVIKSSADGNGILVGIE